MPWRAGRCCCDSTVPLGHEKHRSSNAVHGSRVSPSSRQPQPLGPTIHVPTFATRTQQIGERPPSFAPASLLQEFAPSPTRVKSALRLALGCTVALCLAFLFNWNPASNAMVPPLLLNRSDVRFDLRQSLFAIGSMWVMGAFFYWSLNYVQSLPWFFLVLGAGLFVHAALTTLPGLGPSFSIGQVVSSALLVQYFYEANPRQDVFLPFFSSLVLGFAVALAVNTVVFPYSPRREWDERMRRAWNACRESLAHWFDGKEPAERPAKRPGKLDRQLEEALGPLSEQIKPVDAADPGPAVRQAAVRCLEEVIIRLQDLLRQERDGAGDAGSLESLRAECDARFAWLGGILEGKEAAPPAATADDQANEPSTLAQDDLRQMRAVMDECPDTFRALARLPAGEELLRRDQSLTWSPPFQWKILGKLNAQAWQHGAKVALVVVVTMITWQWLRLPDGQAMLFLSLLAMQPQLGQASRQVLDGYLGVLLGLLFAYLATGLVIKYVETIFGYGLCIFSVLAILGYLAGASPRVAYVAFQGAISFVIVIIFGDRQTVSLEGLRERFVALSFGITIAYFVLHNIWPTRKTKEAFKLVADNFALCAEAWTALLQAKPEDLPARREKFVQDFNQGWAQAVLMLNMLELEGGEGSPRYGYAGRLFTHAVTLFEQVHLLGEEWEKNATWDEATTRRMRAVDERFRALAERLGHPVDPAADDPPESPADDEPGKTQPTWVLQDRLQEVEDLLASLERLTGLPVPT